MQNQTYVFKSVKGENVTLAVARAVRATIAGGYTELVFPKGVYDLDSVFCEQRLLNISNHGLNRMHKIGIVLDKAEHLTVDFSGSTLICHRGAVHLAVLGSRDVTVKNLIIENPETGFLQMKVMAHGDGFVDLLPMQGMKDVRIYGGQLFTSIELNGCMNGIGSNVEFDGETGELSHGIGDCPFGGWDFPERYERLENGMLRAHGVKRYPRVGNVIVDCLTARYGAGVFCEDSEDITFENVTVHTCQGMGLIAQLCRNITLSHFDTRRKDGYFYTANADATHFVNCTGDVTVQDCYFEGQLDDALNIHGIFTRAVAIEQDTLYVCEMHAEAKGIHIYRVGDRVEFLRPDTLLPFAEGVISGVTYQNDDLIALTFEDGIPDGVTVGADVENVTRAGVNLTFRHNTVKDNRARGMLIATRGKVRIEDNLFHTSGAAILFESDGEYWFESGGTRDVTIANNEFDRCNYADWGRAVIEYAGRRATEEGRYYHGVSRITGNTFRAVSDSIVKFDNVESVTFADNTVVPDTPSVAPAVSLFHVGKSEIQADVSITE